MGVAVEGKDVPGVGSEPGFSAQCKERRGCALGQRGNEQFQLAALAFPSNPAPLGLAELALPMQ